MRCREKPKWAKGTYVYTKHAKPIIPININITNLAESLNAWEIEALDNDGDGIEAESRLWRNLWDSGYGEHGEGMKTETMMKASEGRLRFDHEDGDRYLDYGQDEYREGRSAFPSSFFETRRQKIEMEIVRL